MTIPPVVTTPHVNERTYVDETNTVARLGIDPDRRAEREEDRDEREGDDLPDRAADVADGPPRRGGGRRSGHAGTALPGSAPNGAVSSGAAGAAAPWLIMVGLAMIGVAALIA